MTPFIETFAKYAPQEKGLRQFGSYGQTAGGFEISMLSSS